MKKIYFVLLFITIEFSLLAQQKPGTWKEYFSFNKIIGIAQSSAGQLIACSDNGFYFLKNNEYEKFTKIQGLSDINITAFAYDNESNKIILAYQNGNIDIIGNYSVKNLPFVKDKQMAINKLPNQIFVYEDNAFVCFEFGIVKINLKTEEISETYVLSGDNTYTPVKTLIVKDSLIFAGTSQGLFYCNSDQNLANFSNWSQEMFFDQKTVYKLVNFNGNITALYTDGSQTYMAWKENGSWQNILPQETGVINIFATNEKLYLLKDNGIVVYNSNLLKIKEITEISGQQLSPMCVFVSSENVLYIGDAKSGLIKYSDEPEFFLPDAPGSNEIAHIDYSNGLLVATHGGFYADLTNKLNPAEAYVFDNGHWTTVSNPSTYDFTTVAVDPTIENRFSVGAWNDGIYTYRNEAQENYFPEIQGITDYKPQALYYDTYGILWALIKGETPLNAYFNGQWFAPPQGSLIKNYTAYKILAVDDKIFIAAGSRGIFMSSYEVGDQPALSNTMVFYPKDDDGELIGSQIKTIAFDKKEQILWFGSTDGIGVVSNIDWENREYTTSRIRIETQGEDTVIVNYLLKGSTINDLELDPANRLWIATPNGVYLTDNFGTEQLAFFNSENSPLPSDNVSDIAINPETGEVFFATGKGLVSYFSDASAGKNNYEQAYVFPNPVRHEYSGNVVIKGLTDGTYVKITDISGNLVYETVSNGGTAIWNGLLPNGEKPATGVYLIFLTNQSKSSSKVLKLLIIN